MLLLVKFLVEANHVIHHDLHLRTIEKASLCVILNSDWDRLRQLGMEDEDAAAVGGFSRLFLKQLKQQEPTAGLGIKKRTPVALGLLQSALSVTSI